MKKLLIVALSCLSLSAFAGTQGQGKDQGKGQGQGQNQGKGQGKG